MLGRPMVALRGSFRPRLASTTGEDPRATTDPDESPSEYSHAPAPRTRVPPSAPRRRGRPRERAHRRMPRPSLPSSRRRRPAMTRRGTRAVRRTGSNAPRMAARRSTPGRRACGAVRHGRCTSRGTGRPSRLPDRHGERSRLVVPTLGQPAPRERHPRDRVGGRAARPRPWRRRARPRRSATPRTSAGGSPRAPAPRTGTANERTPRAEAGNPGTDRPRRGQGRPHRSHHGGPSGVERRAAPVAERPGPCAAPRAPRREHDVERPAEHDTTLAGPTDIGRARDGQRYGRSSSIGAGRPRTSIRSRDCVRMHRVGRDAGPSALLVELGLQDRERRSVGRSGAPAATREASSCTLTRIESPPHSS